RDERARYGNLFDPQARRQLVGEILHLHIGPHANDPRLRSREVRGSDPLLKRRRERSALEVGEARRVDDDRAPAAPGDQRLERQNEARSLGVAQAVRPEVLEMCPLREVFARVPVADVYREVPPALREGVQEAGERTFGGILAEETARFLTADVE